VGGDELMRAPPANREAGGSVAGRGREVLMRPPPASREAGGGVAGRGRDVEEER